MAILNWSAIYSNILPLNILERTSKKKYNLLVPQMAQVHLNKKRRRFTFFNEKSNTLYADSIHTIFFSILFFPPVKLLL